MLLNCCWIFAIECSWTVELNFDLNLLLSVVELNLDLKMAMNLGNKLSENDIHFWILIWTEI